MALPLGKVVRYDITIYHTGLDQFKNVLRLIMVTFVFPIGKIDKNVTLVEFVRLIK